LGNSELGRDGGFCIEKKWLGCLPVCLPSAEPNEEGAEESEGFRSERPSSSLAPGSFSDFLVLGPLDELIFN